MTAFQKPVIAGITVFSIGAGVMCTQLLGREDAPTTATTTVAAVSPTRAVGSDQGVASREANGATSIPLGAETTESVLINPEVVGKILASPDELPAEVAREMQSNTTSPLGGKAQFQSVNWFSDYLTCIFGVGVPLGVARYIAIVAGNPAGFAALKGMAKNNPVLGMYLQRVGNACWRFIWS